jgi:hypothetical protein
MNLTGALSLVNWRGQQMFCADELARYNETKSMPLATVSPQLCHQFRNYSVTAQIREEIKQICIIDYIKLSS